MIQSVSVPGIQVRRFIKTEDDRICYCCIYQKIDCLASNSFPKEQSTCSVPSTGDRAKKFVPYVAVHIFVSGHSKIAIARTLRIINTTLYSEDNLAHLIYVCI